MSICPHFSWQSPYINAWAHNILFHVSIKFSTHGRCSGYLLSEWLKTTFHFALDFERQEFWKSSTGQFISDPCDISWGVWGWRVTFQDGFSTRIAGISVLLDPSLHTAYYPSGPLHVAWTPHSIVVSEQSVFLHGSWLPRNQDRSCQST